MRHSAKLVNREWNVERLVFRSRAASASLHVTCGCVLAKWCFCSSDLRPFAWSWWKRERCRGFAAKNILKCGLQAISIKRKGQKTGIFSANGSKLCHLACIVNPWETFCPSSLYFSRYQIALCMIFVHISRTSCIIVASFRDQIFSRKFSCKIFMYGTWCLIFSEV